MGTCIDCNKHFKNSEVAFENPKGKLTNCNECYQPLCRKCAMICQKCAEENKPIMPSSRYNWDTAWVKVAYCKKCIDKHRKFDIECDIEFNEQKLHPK